ncbi:MAG: hypothetical protein KKH98_07415, partial [Spirochaetes bacterium]|nr:hypothetical protein [Spirochaetota bacterium]
LEKERQRIAEQLYIIALRILDWHKSHSKKDYSELDNRKDLTQHNEIIDFCIGAFFYLEVISPWDIMYIAPLEREGINYGYKREAESKGTREEEAFKELEETEKEFEE